MTDRTAYVHARGHASVRIREWLLYAGAWTVRRLTRPFGIWSLAAALAPLGALVATRVPAFRARVERNLALVRPDLDAAARRRLTAEAGRAFLRLAVEYSHIDRFARQVRIELSGTHHLRAAREAGPGLVLVTAHYGNWEAIRLAARQEGIECGIFYRAFNNRYLDRFTLAQIGCCGEPVLQKGKSGLRAVVRHLEAGGAVLILVDQRSTGAPAIPFLGRPALTSTAAAHLALRTGAALIPALARREPRTRRFRVSFDPPVPTGDPTAAMAEVNARLGARIAERPEQWFWFHNRWKGVEAPHRTLPPAPSAPGETIG
ncbi:MAG: lysophospholipid acyltransferase family protein [Paracoccaceae bacterium]